jgi:hypothetical protein
MGLFDFLFRQRAANSPPPPIRAQVDFSQVGQARLNHLTSLSPRSLRSLREISKELVLPTPDDAASRTLVHSLSDSQFTELLAVQEIFWNGAKSPKDLPEALVYCEECIQRAPWHYFAQKRVGVIYYMVDQGMWDLKLGKSIPYLELSLSRMKTCVELSKDDRLIRLN